MKKTSLESVGDLAAYAGTVASAAALIGTLSRTLGLSVDIAATAVAPAIALAVGLGAKYVAQYIRRAQKSRRVFISYSARDNDLAARLRDLLHQKGAKAWTAADKIAPGQNIQDAVESAIRDSDVVVALLSGPSGDWIKEELKLARAYDIPILPVLTTEDAAVPEEIKNISHLVLQTQDEDAVQNIANTVAP